MRINDSLNNFAMQSMTNVLLQRGTMQASNAFNRSLFSAGSGAQSSNPLLSQDSFQRVNTIKTASSNLSSAINSLSRDAFAGRAASSSNSDAVSARFTGSGTAPARSYSVTVDRIATGQVNEGASMRSEDAYDGASGTQRFSIESGGRTTDLSIEVQDGDTNEDVQRRMAAAINESNTGVRATVETDSDTGESTLRVESLNTGENSAFTITDEGGEGIASRLGIAGQDSITQQAGDAQFTVDGRARTSSTNTVSLTDNLSITLNSETESAVTVSVTPDQDRVRSEIENMVNSYNELYSAGLGDSGSPGGERLASTLLSTVRTYASQLSNVGIGFDTTGRMTIDSARMDEAAESGRLERFFTENSGRNYGFTNQLQRTAGNISRNPVNFVSSPMFDGSFENNSFYNSAGFTNQFNLFNTGLMFNFMF